MDNILWTIFFVTSASILLLCAAGCFALAIIAIKLWRGHRIYYGGRL
jgi:hypothetical protein